MTTNDDLPADAPPAPPAASETAPEATPATSSPVATGPAVNPESPLRFRPLGATGLDVAELALGTWGLSGEGYGPVANREAEAVIRKAVARGITLFETSDAYNHGGTESLLGRLLYDHRDTTLIATRHGVDRSQTPARKCFEPDFLRRAVDASCERLRRPAIDVYLLHNPAASTLRRDELRMLMRHLKDDKRVRFWGASVGDVETGMAAIDAGADVIELAFNALHASDLGALAARISEKRVGVLARSVLAYGLLTGLWSTSKIFPEGDHRRRRWIDADELATRVRQVDALRPLQSSEVPSLRAVALRYVLTNHLVSAAVIGPRSVRQLDQLVTEAGDGPPYLDEDRLAELPVQLAELGLTSW